MNTGYELLKNYIVVPDCRKKRENDDFLIVMNENGDVYYLNSSAKFIYLSFCESMKISDILNLMIRNYEAENDDDIAILKKDLIELIRTFQWQRIIRIMEVKK